MKYKSISLFCIAIPFMERITILPHGFSPNQLIVKKVQSAQRILKGFSGCFLNRLVTQSPCERLRRIKIKLKKNNDNRIYNNFRIIASPDKLKSINYVLITNKAGIFYLFVIKQLTMTLQTGQAAPQFTLYSTDVDAVSLSDFKGKKVVLHFFPLAFTGVCTTQLCTMRDNFGYYDGLNAVVLGISVDSPFTLGRFKAENNYQFNLLSDFNKEVSANYGALYEEFALGLKGVSKRAAFVIDEEQNIIYAEVLEDAGKLPNFEAIAEVVK